MDDENKYEIMIPVGEMTDVLAIIRRVAETANKLGLDRKAIKRIEFKKLFGDGMKITLEVDNKWFKII